MTNFQQDVDAAVQVILFNDLPETSTEKVT